MTTRRVSPIFAATCLSAALAAGGIAFWAVAPAFRLHGPETAAIPVGLGPLPVPVPVVGEPSGQPPGVRVAE
ncbi:hypothetical protein JW899_02125 [Candidatus Uhrbacteria bacterium]|nr:hypothetical protein [Candidatus Uhrbacteria bacterium]